MSSSGLLVLCWSLLVVVIVCVVLPSVHSSSLTNHVVTLTPDNISHITQNYNVLTYFYSPRCGHCKRFSPQIHKLAALIHQSNMHEHVLVAQMDMYKYPNMAQAFSVNGFPTLKLFTKRQHIQDRSDGKEFKAERTIHSLLDFLHSELHYPE